MVQVSAAIDRNCFMAQPLPERLSRAEEIYLRNLLLIPDGVLQRRAIRTRKVMAIVFAVCMLAIAFAVPKNAPLLGAAALGMVAGASAVFWIIATSTRFRAPVMMRICNWERAKELLADLPKT